MRLLLAEDEKELARALSTILQHNNYSVDVVYNGQDALDYLETELYDGAVLDIMMPQKDGLSVVRELRAKGNPVPILLLTAKSEVDDLVEGLDAGADDYITKPFITKELLARIRATTRRQVACTDPVLSFGNTSLNRANFTVTCPAGSFRCSNKEFQILEMLMANPGRLISTETFMDKIWGYDTDTEISVVWVYISCLRKKLTSIGANIQIKTNRSVGYMLEETK